MRLTHGESVRRTPEYVAWLGMRQRCTNTRNKRYKYYGARGIGICRAWLDDYGSFLAAVGRRPAKGYSIDRIKNNRGYVPGNVRWATQTVQVRNRRDSKDFTFMGVTAPLVEWAARIGVPYITLWERFYKLGWSVERALSTPRRLN